MNVTTSFGPFRGAGELNPQVGALHFEMEVWESFACS